MVLAIITGYLIGTVLAFFIARWLLNLIASRLARTPEEARWIRIVGSIFGAISVAPAIFIAVLAGGFVDTGSIGVVIAGLPAIIIGTIVLVTAMGATSGYLLARGIFSGRTNP